MLKRNGTMALVAIGLLAFTSPRSCAQTGEVELQEEEVGIEYIVQCAEMSRYMAYVVGTNYDPSTQPEGTDVHTDFEMIFAMRREKQGKTTTRFEQTGRRLFSSGRAENIDERRLMNSENDWVHTRYTFGDIVETRRFEANGGHWSTKPESVNPLYLPIADTSSVRSGIDATAFERYMPSGRLMESQSVGTVASVGKWITGDESDFIDVITFDHRYGGMPTEHVARVDKRGFFPLDKTSSLKQTVVYQQQKTKWALHKKSGYWLPVEIESSDHHRTSEESYEVKIHWWIDDEVPDEIFDLKDLKKAVIRASKAHEMIEDLKDAQPAR